MNYRRFGKTNWQVSEIGYGMWGLAGWTGTDEQEVIKALELSVEMGCNFFDTAWAYGDGVSETILNNLLIKYPDKKLYFATKIPPKNWKWPAKPNYLINDVYPEEHIIEYTEKSLKNLGVEQIDVQQFHVWTDNWHDQDEWKKGVEKLKQSGKIKHIGISINRWEPDNVLKTLQTGLIDTVQVIYNIFDQNPETNLFPLCRELDIAVIARVPFDEGTLTGTFTKETTFPPNDWRSIYFVKENLYASVERADALKPLLTNNITMPEMALKFILANTDVATVIPGMRKIKHVQNNCSISNGNRLSNELLIELKKHRWDRTPTSWSQ